MDEKSNAFGLIYSLLSEYYGQQPWWPADDEFEIMVGAIPTQNTAWTNVEKALPKKVCLHRLSFIRVLLL